MNKAIILSVYVKLFINRLLKLSFQNEGWDAENWDGQADGTGGSSRLTYLQWIPFILLLQVSFISQKKPFYVFLQFTKMKILF